MSKYADIPRCKENEAHMTETGSIGAKERGNTQKYQSESRHSFNPKMASAITVDYIFGQMTSWKSTIWTETTKITKWKIWHYYIDTVTTRYMEV